MSSASFKRPVETLKTWTNSQKEEDAMFRGHFDAWQAVIDAIEENNLQNRSVLDFGCNQGGFLRMLYNARPFAKGYGVDIAADSLARADSLNPGLPIAYGAPLLMDNLAESIDIAFSHEVLYLLQDLDAHAREIAAALKPNGIYYAVTGCHTENPLWPEWHKTISAYSNIPVPDYSLNDYAAAFLNNGFSIGLRALRPQGFMRFEEDDQKYFPRLIDKLTYYQNHKIIFRFAKE